MKLGHPESVRLASNHIQLMTVNYSMEHREGIEPSNTGFADQRVSHFATGAHLALRAASLIKGCPQSLPTLPGWQDLSLPGTTFLPPGRLHRRWCACARLPR